MAEIALIAAPEHPPARWRAALRQPLTQIGVALVAMFFAWRRVFRPVEKCQPGEVCAVPRVRTGYKAIFWLVSLLVLIALVFPYILPLFY